LKKVFFTIIIALSSLNLVAQDVSFSQSFLNPLYVNPAYTGVNEGLRVCINYRNLWNKIPSKFPSYTISADAQDLRISSGLGLNILNDVEGEGSLHTQAIGGFYSYRAVLVPKKWIFQVGVQTSLISKRIDWSSLIFSDQIDPVLGVIKPANSPAPAFQSVLYPDFSAGGIIRGNHYTRFKKLSATTTIGFAVHHIVQPNESIVRQNSIFPRRIVAHAGVLIPFRNEISKNKFAINPQFMWEQQGPMTTFNFALLTVVQPIYAGIMYRNQTPVLPNVRDADAMIICFGINNDWNKEIFYKIGYSYDLTISDLKSSTAGSHEIAIVVEFRKFKFSKGYTAKKKTECPDF
jgi:type IX secretion system PorP/SprF family membrane protein